MAKPRLIIVVRHAQSEGNKNRDIHQTIPDHRVKLTPEGWAQANDAGLRLRRMLRPDDTLHFFTSPYRRTRETTEGILDTLTADDPEPSLFRRADIKVYEEPRLREQDFGNFQPCSAEMERMWQERADYGHFFYRIPNGESAADAYDRVSGFNESLWRQFGDDDFASVCVLVTHGLMSRVFLMKWYHFTVEYFEDLRNIDHCEFLTMRMQPSGKYLLENKLRTWSDLRRERALAIGKDEAALDRARAAVVNRRWGGCPDGCNHTKHFNKRHDLETLRQRDGERKRKPSAASLTIAVRRQRHLRAKDAAKDAAMGAPGRDNASREADRDAAAAAAADNAAAEDDDDEPAAAAAAAAADADDDDDDDCFSSPSATPSFITASHRLHGLNKLPPVHVGRDFGGSYSGHNSLSDSDSDASRDDDGAPRRLSRVSACLCADADAPSDVGGGGGGGGDEDRDKAAAGLDDVDRAEREERSVRESVY